MNEKLKLVRWCPTHAIRLARALPPILRRLPPLSAPTSAEVRGERRDGASGTGESESRVITSVGDTSPTSTAATAALVSLRRPLQVLLRAGRWRNGLYHPPSCDEVEELHDMDGADTSGDTTRVPNKRDRDDVAILASSMIGDFSTDSCSSIEFERLLPRCIVPLFEAVVTGQRVDTAAAGPKPAKANVEGEGSRSGTESGESESGYDGVVACLGAVLEVCDCGGGVSVETEATVATAQRVAFAALDRCVSLSTCSDLSLVSDS